MHRSLFYFFFFNDTATTEIYTLSLHDALPICCLSSTACLPKRSFTTERPNSPSLRIPKASTSPLRSTRTLLRRSEEHTSELQSRPHLVCRLLLEKKKKKKYQHTTTEKYKQRIK